MPAVRTDQPHRSLPALAAWVAGLGATIVACHALGAGPLAGPPLLRPSAWPTWLAGRDPAVAAMSIVRLGVLGAAWYLAALTALAAGGRALGSARTVAAAVRVAPLPARRVLVAALGAGVLLASAVRARPATVAVGGTILAAADAGPAPTRTLRRLDGPAPVSPPPTASPALPPPPQAAAPPTTKAAPRAPSPPATPAPPVAAEPPTTRVGDEWVVRPGEHFWSIARAHLAEAWGREPTVREVGRHWRALVAANRDRLADPANPDLIFPGQHLRLPPPPAPGGRR